MKRLPYLFILIFLAGFSLVPIPQNSIPAEISLAFKAGNVEKLAEYLNTTVELVILEKEDFYKKSVAESILKDFFKEYQTTDFVIKHQGGKDNAYYAIGNLITKKGSFRVYFLIKKVDSKPLIHQLRIEKDEN